MVPSPRGMIVDRLIEDGLVRLCEPQLAADLFESSSVRGAAPAASVLPCRSPGRRGGSGRDGSQENGDLWRAEVPGIHRDALCGLAARRHSSRVTPATGASICGALTPRTTRS